MLVVLQKHLSRGQTQVLGWEVRMMVVVQLGAAAEAESGEQS
jgi:hypothetical protein